MKGAKAGRPTLIYWDCSKCAIPPRRGAGKAKSANTVRHTMGLIDSCCMYSMTFWENTSKVGMDYIASVEPRAKRQVKLVTGESHT